MSLHLFWCRSPVAMYTAPNLLVRPYQNSANMPTHVHLSGVWEMQTAPHRYKLSCTPPLGPVYRAAMFSTVYSGLVFIDLVSQPLLLCPRQTDLLLIDARTRVVRLLDKHSSVTLRLEREKVIQATLAPPEHESFHLDLDKVLRIHNSAVDSP